jgi:hypothetical protein
VTGTLNRASSYARGHTEKALTTLVKIMEDEEAPPTARVTAANSILDRGWGKPAQPISGDPDNPVNIITRIELVGVKSVQPPPY